MAHAGDLEQWIKPAGPLPFDFKGPGNDVRGGSASLAQCALAAVLADAYQLESGGAYRSERLIKREVKGGFKRHVFGGRLHSADKEMMTARLARSDRVFQRQKKRRLADGPERLEPADSKLDACRARFRRQLPRIDFMIEHAKAGKIAASGGFKSKPQIRQLLGTLGGDDLGDQKSEQRCLIMHQAEPGTFLKTEGMSVGAGWKERVGCLEQKWQPGQLGGHYLMGMAAAKGSKNADRGLKLNVFAREKLPDCGIVDGQNDAVFNGDLEMEIADHPSKAGSRGRVLSK
ncbi:MAG: hypothetical protein JWL90_860 [Chthoniobacteraceae bacterium]|nr:hypothetical protein [Chthoniobacteraceae bacterium]